ncbi:MAG TPA: hypothetical protein VHJ59_05765 [Nitrososphaera sp.]|jgi:hypothetical protein|nr:hypothetical protein [Nitrososphaera sp.]
MSFLSTLAMHKGVLIAATAAVVLLAYFMPLDSMFGMVSAAKGGNTGNENPNRYKVCDFPFDEDKPGNQNPPPKCPYVIRG